MAAGGSYQASSARRNLFGMSPVQNQRTSQQSSANSFYGHSRDQSRSTASSFYGRRRDKSQDFQSGSRPTASSIRNNPRNEGTPVTQQSATSLSGHSHEESRPGHQTWQPGELLPTTYNDEYSTSPDFHSLIAEMQTVITTEIEKVHASITVLSNRVSRVEKDLSDTAGQRLSCQTPTSSSCTDSGGDKSRKKRTPIALSNLVRSIHTNLPPEKQLKTDENMDGGHNRMVVALVKEEISEANGGKDFSDRDIKGALSTYRRTLGRKMKDCDATTEQRLKRSRQQRKFERRGRHVQDPEKDMWADVTPAMMSGEEDIGNNTFKVHQPEWRSEELNKLFKDPELIKR